MLILVVLGVIIIIISSSSSSVGVNSSSSSNIRVLSLLGIIFFLLSKRQENVDRTFLEYRSCRRINKSIAAFGGRHLQKCQLLRRSIKFVKRK